MIEGWMFIGRGVREDSLDGRVLDSSGEIISRNVWGQTPDESQNG